MYIMYINIYNLYSDTKFQIIELLHSLSFHAIQIKNIKQQQMLIDNHFLLQTKRRNSNHVMCRFLFLPYGLVMGIKRVSKQLQNHII